ncbi:hypothetical protein BJ742DRAFT_682399, partial [Cladochytrium replicatum]
VLEWWKLSGLRTSFLPLILHVASAAGHISFLDWWRWSVDCSMTQWIMQVGMATFILQWWKDSGLELEWTE